jgi:hypothetical protein
MISTDDSVKKTASKNMISTDDSVKKTASKNVFPLVVPWIERTILFFNFFPTVGIELSLC